MTPAIQMLQRARLAYELREYDHDPSAEAYGLEAARKLGVDPSRVYKTLVAEVDGRRLVLAIIPVAARVNLKRLAKAAGGKRAKLADPAAAERATGYVVGGISPLGGKQRLAAFADDSITSHEQVLVSAGRRGLQIALAPADLLHACGGRCAALADLSRHA